MYNSKRTAAGGGNHTETVRRNCKGACTVPEGTECNKMSELKIRKGGVHLEGN